jgi:hypothetical protein
MRVDNARVIDYTVLEVYSIMPDEVIFAQWTRSVFRVGVSATSEDRH